MPAEKPVRRKHTARELAEQYHVDTSTVRRRSSRHACGSPSPTTSPSAPPTPGGSTGDVYDTPGFHRVGGRTWQTTCEPYSQTLRCRTDIWATTVEAVDGRATVIAGVGYDVARAIELARTAERHGAEAVMVHQPVHPYQSTDGWVAYHRAIADADRVGGRARDQGLGEHRLRSA